MAAAALGKRVGRETEDGFSEAWRSMDAQAQSALALELERRHGASDWRTLSAAEWRALYTSRYGAPARPDRWLPLRVAAGTLAVVGAGAGMYAAMRSLAPPRIPSMDPEYQRALRERAVRENMNPMFGAASRARVASPETVSLD